MHPMLAPKTRPRGVPHRLLGVILEVFGALGRSWRSWALWASVEGRFEWLWGGLGQLLSGSGVASGGVFGGLGELLGVMLAPKMVPRSGKSGKKCCSKTHAFPQCIFDGFYIQEKQPGRPQNLYLSLGIPVSNAYRRFQHRHRILFVLGANMAPCWPPKCWKIVVWRASGRLLGALGRLQEALWRCQEALGRLQKVLEGFW